jgi:hypothetical protein
MTDFGDCPMLLTPVYFLCLDVTASPSSLTLVNCDRYSMGQTFKYLVCRGLFTPTVTFYSKDYESTCASRERSPDPIFAFAEEGSNDKSRNGNNK